MLMLLLTVAMVRIVALMSPGPDFLLVSQAAVSHSRKEAMMGVLGTTCDVMVWAGIALFSLYLIIEKMAWLHMLIMVGGGLYLCWTGYQMPRGALKKEVISTPVPQVELAENGCSFLEGLLTNLANPKAIIYLGPVSSLFVGDSVGTTERWDIFALIIVEILTWFIVVVNLFALPQMRRGYRRLAKWTDGSVGALFAGFGARLIISH